MVNVREITVRLITIFPSDYIPYAYILRQDFIEHMKEIYKFEKHDIPLKIFRENSPNIIGFSHGLYSYDGRKIIIDHFVLEDRKLILSCKDNSNIAKTILGHIVKDIRKFTGLDFNLENSILSSEETICIASLDIDHMKLFSPKLKQFINNEFASHLKNRYSRIYPKNLSFEVEFEQSLLESHRITLSPKTLTIEPRAGHPLEEKLYFTESPLDSDTHLKLLESFEKIFAS